VLANKSENIFAYADSAHSNGPVADNFREFAEDSSGTPGGRARSWDFQFGSFTDIARDDHWADPWREFFANRGLLACHSVPILEPEGTEIGCVILCFSEQREANEFEKHLAQFVSSLVAIMVSREQSARELRTQVEQIERLAVVGRLSASISHEINNPLGAVTNLLYLLSGETGLSPAGKTYLSSAQAELQRISEIAAQTLQFYKKRTLTERCSLADIIRGLLILYRGRIQHGRISIRFDEQPTEPVLCHAGELRQVFANLLTNAVDALGEGAGTIQIRIRPGAVWKSSAPGVRVTIADNGTGMDPEVRARIYKAFFTTKPVSGTGLGLWVSAGIVDRHGGSICVRSRKGVGTAFTVALPIEGPSSKGL
jgi:signal transduction histidine kinase